MRTGHGAPGGVIGGHVGRTSRAWGLAGTRGQLQGRVLCFAGRVAASLLEAVGLPELITRTAEEYEKTALELATDPARLTLIRDKLAQNRLSASLFDTDLFTRHIESAYEAMHKRHQAGQTPDHIHVPNLRTSLPQTA